MFHVWGAFVCASAAVARRVWLPFGDTAIYPNLYCMFVGDAGNGKSHALNKAKRLMSELEFPMSYSVETPEGLLKFMDGDPTQNPPIQSPVSFPTKWPDGVIRDVYPMTIVANEFIDFISKNPSGWTSMLNNIYDEDSYNYRTKNQGENTLVGPYMVLLGALPTDVSFDLQKIKIITTGFARRTIFQFGERQWNNPHAIPSGGPEVKEAKRKSLEHLKRITQAKGEFFWSQDTQDWWKKWYDNHTESVPYKPPTVKSWFTNKPTQVQKLAMLYSLFESNELVVTPAHFESAIHFLEIMEGDLHKVFGGVGRNELAALAVNIQSALEVAKGPWTRKYLQSTYYSSFKNTEEVNSVVQQLIDTGVIVEKTFGINGVKDETVIGVPALMDSFFAKLAQPDDAAQLSSTLATVCGVDPSTAKFVTLVRQMTEAQAGSQPAVGTAPAPPRYRPKEE